MYLDNGTIWDYTVTNDNVECCLTYFFMRRYKFFISVRYLHTIVNKDFHYLVKDSNGYDNSLKDCVTLQILVTTVDKVTSTIE